MIALVPAPLRRAWQQFTTHQCRHPAGCDQRVRKDSHHLNCDKHQPAEENQ